MERASRNLGLIKNANTLAGRRHRRYKHFGKVRTLEALAGVEDRTARGHRWDMDKEQDENTQIPRLQASCDH